MSTKDIAFVTGHRLNVWSERLVENHSTPAVLIGVGHDHKSGELHICIPHDMPLQMAHELVLKALAEFDAEVGVAGKKVPHE
jgi:hypothetical protein